MLLTAALTVFALTQYLEPRIPTLADRDRFPSEEVARANESLFTALTHEAVAKLNAEPHNAAKVEPELKLVQFRAIAWGQLLKCHVYPAGQQLRCLAELRRHIGDDAYFAGVIPDRPPPKRGK